MAAGNFLRPRPRIEARLLRHAANATPSPTCSDCCDRNERHYRRIHAERNLFALTHQKTDNSSLFCRQTVDHPQASVFSAGTLVPLPALRHLNGARISFPQRSCQAEGRYVAHSEGTRHASLPRAKSRTDGREARLLSQVSPTRKVTLVQALAEDLRYGRRKDFQKVVTDSGPCIKPLGE